MIQVCSTTGRLEWWACLSDGSGVSREAHAPFCERPGVRFPRSTLLLDVWFEDVVRPRLQGEALLVRYADDSAPRRRRREVMMAN